MFRFAKPHAALLLALALACALAAQTEQVMPTIEGETFSGRKIVLPEAARCKVAVLIFGFTKASKEPTSEWADKIYSDLGSRNGFEMYQLPVLEDVPRFIRGMVISGMKKGVRENMRDHFMPILQHEAELKRLVNYNEPNDAYLVLLDQSGRIVQQQHGVFNDSAYGQFRTHIDRLLTR